LWRGRDIGADQLTNHIADRADGAKRLALLRLLSQSGGSNDAGHRAGGEGHRDNVLPADRLGRVRDALYRAASEDRARGWEQKFRIDYAHDDTNQRVWNLLSRDPVFADLVEDPL